MNVSCNMLYALVLRYNPVCGFVLSKYVRMRNTHCCVYAADGVCVWRFKKKKLYHLHAHCFKSPRRKRMRKSNVCVWCDLLCP